jgi:hypothetical protein
MTAHPWLRAFLILVAICAVIIAIASPAFAEGGMHSRHQQHQMPDYSVLDADGDGKVTAEEFYAFRASRMQARAAEGRKMKHAANAPAFEDLDLDADGSLSADEFAKHHARCPMHNKAAQEDDD